MTILPPPWQRGQSWARTNSPKALRTPAAADRPRCSAGTSRAWSQARRRSRVHVSTRDRDRERDVALHAAAPPRRGRSRPLRRTCPAAGGVPERSEDVVSEEGREEVGEVPEVEVGGPEAAGAEPLVSVPVVELAGLGLREHLVGLGHLAEALLGGGIVGDIGMELAGERPKRLLDRSFVGVPRHPEQLVVVTLVAPSSTPPPARLRHSSYSSSTKRDSWHGRRPHRLDRLDVVHASRAEQADRAEIPVREPVGRARRARPWRTSGRRAPSRPARRPLRVERRSHEVEERRPALDRLEHATKRADVLATKLVHHTGRSTDVHAPARSPRRASVKAGRSVTRKLALPRRETRVLEASCAACGHRASARQTCSFRYSAAHPATWGRPARRRRTHAS